MTRLLRAVAGPQTVAHWRTTALRRTWVVAALSMTLGSCGSCKLLQLGAGDDCQLPGDAAREPGDAAANATRIEHLLALADCEASLAAKAEGHLLNLIEKLNRTGKLKPTLVRLAQLAAKTRALPELPDHKLRELAGQLAASADAALCAKARAPGCEDNLYTSWDALAEQHLAQVRASAVTPAGPDEPSRLLDPTFVRELEALSGARFVAGNHVRPLIDGPESFAERDRLLENAQKSIHVLTWALYDDGTGRATVDSLLKKAKAGLDVRVIVDGQTSNRKGYGSEIERLRSGGVPVLRWQDSERRHDGQHRKLLVVDNTVAIAGGINIGDWYSHRGPPDAERWRDTDVLLRGPAVRGAVELFARVYNTATRADRIPPAAAPANPAKETGSARVAWTDHEPGRDAHIMLATLKVIEGATKSVDIQNAYFIMTPGIERALVAAIERGVKVRIVTNSANSIDEPVMTQPMMDGLKRVVQGGAELYLWQGHTLHSKFMLVDGVYAWVGSYNLHPRSHRYEGELAVQILDTAFVQDLTRSFDLDVSKSTRVTSSAQLDVPRSSIALLAARYFFDQL